MKSKDNEDAQSDDEGDDGAPGESFEQFQARINLFVQIHLMRTPNSKRDHYKDGLVYQARKELINSFLKTTLTKQCQNNDCGASVELLQKNMPLKTKI